MKFFSFRSSLLFVSSLLAILATGSARIDSAAARARAAPDTTIVDRIDRANLMRIVEKLSGADTVLVGAEPVRIRTRYALSEPMKYARSYLASEIRAIGYQPSIQSFILNIDVPDLTGAAFSPLHDVFLTADAEGTVYRANAEDGWARFEKCGDIDQVVFDLECDSRGRFWAACRLSGSAAGGLYLSTHAGDDWSLKASGSNTYALVTITFEDEQFGMAGGSNGSVVRTGDGGETWESIDPARLGYESLMSSATNGPMHFWFVTDSGALYETLDLGGTWSRRVLASAQLFGIDFYGENAGVIVGSRMAFYTKNAGATWVRVDVPTEFTAVCMADSLRIIAAGTGGEIWSSGDGGASWTRFGTECSLAADVWRVVDSGNGSFWLAGRDLVRLVSWAPAVKSCAAYQLADTLRGQNISFRREGARERDRRVLLTAHYDSFSSQNPFECAPGADDNATGVAAVLECARILRAERTERSVEFVLFDGEELGLLGSRYFAQRLDTGIVYEGVLNLDMIGYEPNEVMTAVIGQRAPNVGDSILAARMAAAIDSFGLELVTTPIQANLTSDQLAFWEVGVPAVLLIEGTRAELTPNYHKCSDGAGALTPAFLETCAKAALGTVALIAGILPPQEIPPERIALRQNYPNPFNAGTIVSYALPFTTTVEIAVYDVSGRRVALVERARKEAGIHEKAWDGKAESGRNLPSGVYFLSLRSGAGGATRKIVVLR